ncbi:type II secretion system secretin GspD [Myxococcota bacterium]|nr:type II secretion system secretin GspD [Myxococcota bacterium]
MKRIGMVRLAGAIAALLVFPLGQGSLAAQEKKPRPATGTGVLPRTRTLPPPAIPGQATPPQAAPAQSPGPSSGGPAAAPAAASGAAAGARGGRTASAPAAVPAEETQETVTFKTNFQGDERCVAMPLNARVSLDFEEAPLWDVVKFIACITQRNYIVAANMKAGKTITILSTTKVTVYEAYRAFLSALDVNGLTVVPAGPFYKIVETAKAKTEPVPLYGSRDAVPDEDRLVTRIVPLRYIDVKTLEPVVSKFKTGAGDITSYPPGNSLIITDLGRNVNRILQFVAELDVPTGKEKIWVRPIQYASAAEMANLVTTLFGDKAGGKGTTATRAPAAGQPAGPQGQGTPVEGAQIEGPVSVSKVIADERTNSLIIVATPAAYLRIDQLLRRMDAPIEGEGQIHIYYLENAAAEDIASTLQALASGAGARKGGGKGGGGSAPASPAPSAGGGAASLFSGEVRITAHKPTNSLVIEASLKDYLSIKRVIQQLDVRRKQVYVEAVIMEISSNKDRKVGISGSGGTSFNIGGNSVPLLLGMGGLGISGLDMNQLNKGGLAIGLTGPLVDVATGTTGSSSTAGALALPSYGFLIQAFQSNSDVNILSTPHILTMDNEEAEIVVGKQIPYQASSLGGNLTGLLSSSGLLGSTLGGTTGTTGTSALGGLATSLLGGYGGYGMGAYVQRIDVDLTLKITPQISESNFVRLQIQQQIDDVEALDASLGPTTSKRKVSNTVVVRDQQPVVIGGLIRDIEVTGVDKVPFLGDIPVLGVLFRKTAKRTEKRNLLMIITPYIIEDPSDLRRIHEQKMEEMRQFAEYMATRKKEMEGAVDYRKKTGLLEDIRRTMDRVRKDRELLEQSRFEEVDRVGAPESHDLDHDPFQQGTDGEGAGPGTGTPATAAPAAPETVPGTGGPVPPAEVPAPGAPADPGTPGGE